MAADIDARVISTFSSLPEATIANLAENPTAELVKSFLQNIEKKAKEYEQFKSQKLKLEVELETVVRTNESKTKVLQNSRDKALSDVSKLREDVQKAENAKAQAEADLEGLRQSTNQEATEITNLRARISSLEASNRDTLAMHESKSSAYDRLSQELSTQHQKLVDLRKQVSSLEQANQEAASAATSAKFKQASLEQELELQKKNIDWYENERKIKAEEHQNFRKEKNARVTELQRLNENYIDQAESLRRSETTLKHQLEEQIKKNDDLITELEKLREESVNEHENHRMEVENINRLAQLQQASAETAKRRVQELSNALEEAREEASDEIGRIRAEIQNEHNDREAAEQRVSELESRVVELESEVQQAQIQPNTPRKDINGGNLSTPQRPSTPLGSFTPKSTTRAKPGMSVTQLYSAYTQLERDLAAERRANEQLQTHVDSMLEDLEANKPEIDELRSDQNRLQSEVFEMSTLAEQANIERDAAVKEARLVQGQLDALGKQLSDAQQALRDRNSQLRRLLLEQRAGTISDFDFQRLQQEAAAADERDMEHLSETQQDVNRYLVLFRNVEELQSINENQLTTIRNLAAKLESEQSQERQQKFKTMEKELEEARAQIVSYQDEVKSMVNQSKSFVKERDMFRSMLTRRGQALGQIDPTDFSRSMPLPAGGSPGRGAEDGPVATENDYGRALRELQMNFDNYRQETSTDTSALRKQVSDLSQRNNQLQLDASRAQAQLTAATQRYEMIQSNFNMLKNENSETQKRSWAAMEAATKQELKTQETAEQLVGARGMVESLQRESANLKAEKDLWKTVEKRLIDDNESLRNERSRLDQLNANLQNLINEREHSDSETRRRLQSQAESLENELQSAKRKLEEEIEDNKKTTLRREYEHEQSQKRIDDLVTSLGNTREELSAVKTARDHLQARVDEMTVELRSAEERLEIYTMPVQDPSQHTNGAEEASVSREQELVSEISELKRDLELKTSDLVKANEQIETFKSISQEAEDRLQGFMETNDQFKAESEASLIEKDARIKDLEQRIEDISSELSTTNTELSKIRDRQAEADRRLEEQKSSLEAEISRLKDSEEKALEQASFNLEASKAQAQIATDAQQNYETELVKHAEAAKSLQTARSEAYQLRLDLAETKSVAENARNDLEQKETSWSEMESRYKQEIEDVKRRREELVQQNGILHGQLEQLTQQVSALQRDRAANTENEGTQGGETGSQDLNNLQEVIRYLRREKEIVEVQYHLSTQEAKRLKQQYDFAQSQLDETRLKLNQQHRAEVDLERSTISHNKLMETLQELNVYRESSVTLRNDLKQNQQAVAERTKKVEELEAQIQPLQERVTELENLCELREGEIKLLQDDRNHWQQRTQNILSKYDRVDPAELESLKSKISELESERDEANSARDNLQTEIDAHPEAIEAARTDMKNRLQEQFKSRSRELTGRIKEKQTELDTAIEEKTNLQSELDTVKQELEAARIGTQNAGSGNAEVQQESHSEESSAPASEPSARISELEAKVIELQAAINSKDQELAASSSSRDDAFKAKESQLKEILNKRLADFKKEAESAKSAALEELRQSLNAQHQQEIETLRAQLIPVSNEIQKASNDQTATSAEAISSFDQFMTNLTEAQAKLLVQKNETINNIVKSNIKKHVEKEKESLRQQLASEQPSASTEEISSQIEELEKKFAAEKENIIKEKDEEFANEKAALIQQHEENLEAEKKAMHTAQQQEVEKAKNLAQGKMTMLQKQSALAQAKVAVVRKAAEETPDKAVKEVWEVAKSAKPADPPKPATPATTAAPPTDQTTMPAATEAKAEVAPETNGEALTEETLSNEVASVGDAPKPAQPNTSAPTSGLRQPSSSGLPQPARGGVQAGRGRGGAQGAGARGSGLPTFRGNARGGRGGAQGRGASQINTAQTGAGRGGGGAASPSRGGTLNPGAQQFTPGAKRTREDSDSGNTDGNQGKRIRGGGVGT